MKIMKPISLLALIYCCVGPLLLVLEQYSCNVPPAQQALPITLLAVFFFTYSLLELYLFDRLISSGSKKLTHFYLVSKMTRLMLCVLILVGYGFLVREGLLTFAINLFAFYMVTMVFTTVCCTIAERKKKKAEI